MLNSLTKSPRLVQPEQRARARLGMLLALTLCACSGSPGDELGGALSERLAGWHRQAGARGEPAGCWGQPDNDYVLYAPPEVADPDAVESWRGAVFQAPFELGIWNRIVYPPEHYSASPDQYLQPYLGEFCQ